MQWPPARGEPIPPTAANAQEPPMTTVSPRPHLLVRPLPAFIATLALAGCGTVSAPPLPTETRLTVMGRYENLAGCVAEAADKGVAGAGSLRIERERQRATLRRDLSAAGPPQYEITFTQTGATTVQVEGRSAAAPNEGARAFAFIWPHVELCATNQMAP